MSSYPATMTFPYTTSGGNRGADMLVSAGAQVCWNQERLLRTSFRVPATSDRTSFIMFCMPWLTSQVG